MKKSSRRVWAMILTGALAAAGSMTAWAADRTISNVTLRIDSELESGSTLPEIDWSNDGSGHASNGDILITNSSKKYEITEAEWITSTSREMNVGDTPEMKVTLAPLTDGGDDYHFKGSYRASNVSVRYGNFMSAAKKDGNLVVKIRVRAIEGTFAPPEDAYWRDNSRGIARWEEPESGGSGKYEVVLKKGSSRIHSVETTARSYDFYPYMTKEGTYTFRVRTIAKTGKQEDYGDKSEWVESDEIYVAKEDVSDGSGRNDGPGVVGPSGSGVNGNTRVGWQKYNNRWYYYYPDGSYQKNGWARVGDNWYLFNNDGVMLTGWQNLNSPTINNQTYFLRESGEMAVGWVFWNNRWYYMNPTPDAFIGCMLKEHWATINGLTYWFTSDGSMAEGWHQIDGNWYYFYPGSGHKAVNTWVNTFYVNENGIWVQ